MINIILYLILLAALHSKLELMAEGKLGWGLNFPCWRINNTIINFLICKELTGYHFYMCLMFLLLFHGPYLFIKFSWQKELIILGLYLWYWVIEDFLWFAESKHYGLKNFRKGRIYWHKRWKLGLPVSYWWSMIIGTLLLLLGRL